MDTFEIIVAVLAFVYATWYMCVYTYSVCRRPTAAGALGA